MPYKGSAGRDRGRNTKITHTYTQRRRRMTALIITADKIGLHSVAEWFKKLQQNYKNARLANQTIKELSRLSDHELRDLGIARGEIYELAWRNK